MIERNEIHIFRKALFIAPLLLASSLANAFILPYSTRTRDYSSWTPATYGDINTIGMAGATLAVPISISAAEFNPAGFAMLTASVSAQINSLSLDDNTIQRSGDPIKNSQWGFGVSPGEWGFSLSYYSTETESGTYVSTNTEDATRAEVSMKELRLTIARSFFDHRVALALSPEVLKAVRQLDDASSNAYGVSYVLGGLYRLPMHFLFGVSYMPETKVGPAPNPDEQNVMPGFNRTVVRPSLLGFGFGWIPNRFFKIATSLTYVGSTENTALLADQSVITGANATWVPRVGASYIIAEYANLKVEGAVGCYYEVSRLSDGYNRLHATAGIEFNPYFINLGAGFDFSSGYRTLIFSSGFDIVRAARAFDIIPKDPVPPYNGMRPNINHISADGLPNGFTSGEKTQYKSPDVTQVEKIVEDAPGNIAKKVEGEKTTVEIKEDKDKKEQKKKGVPVKKEIPPPIQKLERENPEKASP